jgi:hypothetical protein
MRWARQDTCATANAVSDAVLGKTENMRCTHEVRAMRCTHNVHASEVYAHETHAHKINAHQIYTFANIPRFTYDS